MTPKQRQRDTQLHSGPDRLKSRLLIEKRRFIVNSGLKADSDSRKIALLDFGIIFPICLIIWINLLSKASNAAAAIPRVKACWAHADFNRLLLE